MQNHTHNHTQAKTSKAALSEFRKKFQKEAATFHSLHGWQKVQYIWDYYKLPLAVLCIAAYAAVFTIHGRLTHKDEALYAALVNVTAGQDLTDALTGHFLESQGIDPAKNTLSLYSGLYLTTDENNIYHEYTYASRMKILAAINAKQLDVVFMDQEAFDAFAQNGYLYDLDGLLREEDPSLYEALKPYLVKNTVILEDNAFELIFDESLAYDATTEEYTMGLDLSASPIFQKAGFTETVYMGILQNTERKDMVLAYLQYLCK